MASRSAVSHAPHTNSLLRLANDSVLQLLALGYGCFRGSNSLIYSSAMATYDQSPVMFVPTPLFALATAVCALLGALWITLRAHARNRAHRAPLRLPVIAPAVVLAGMQLLVGGLPSTLASQPTTIVACSVVYAVTSTTLNLAWLVLLIQSGLRRGPIAFALAMVALAGVSLVTPLLSPLARLLTASALLALSTGAILYLRRREPEPPVTLPTSPHSLRAMGSAVLASAVLECCMGFLNGFFVERSLFADAQATFSLGTLGGALAFAAVCLVPFGIPSIQQAYRLLFPGIAAVVGLLPFAGNGENPLLGAALAALYGFLSYCAVACILAITIEHRFDALVVTGCVTVIARGAQLTGFAAGCGLGATAPDASREPYALAGMLTIYALALTLLIISRKKPVRNREPVLPFAQHARELAEHAHLTARETQVLILLAQGRSAAVIAQELVCSAGTVRNHIKSIYAKLGVHSKQEVIDLFLQR